MNFKDLRPTPSTLAHLRFSFSIYLTPVFFYCLCDNPHADLVRASVLFMILVFGIFPSSQGYNSYYDRDEDSIGGLERPPTVTGDLYFVALAVEFVALLLAGWILGWNIALLLLIYGLFSKLYSYPRTRWKRQPWLSFWTVVTMQGGWMYWICRLSFVRENKASWLLWKDVHFLGPAIASSLLIAGSYPLTQIYQHGEDARRGDQTLSRVLGLRGTLVFAGISLGCAVALMATLWHWQWEALVFAISTLPTAVIFASWGSAVWKNSQRADFQSVHRFLRVSAVCAILGFILIFVYKRDFVGG